LKPRPWINSFGKDGHFFNSKASLGYNHENNNQRILRFKCA
jgi:hypothetical protein